MSCCDYCNFKNTDKCVMAIIWAKFDEGEITEEEANIESINAVMDCEIRFHDNQLDQADIRNDR